MKSAILLFMVAVLSIQQAGAYIGCSYLSCSNCAADQSCANVLYQSDIGDLINSSPWIGQEGNAYYSGNANITGSYYGDGSMLTGIVATGGSGTNNFWHVNSTGVQLNTSLTSGINDIVVGKINLTEDGFCNATECYSFSDFTVDTDTTYSALSEFENDANYITNDTMNKTVNFDNVVNRGSLDANSADDWDIDNTTSWYALVMPWDTVNATSFYSTHGWDADNATAFFSGQKVGNTTDEIRAQFSAGTNISITAGVIALTTSSLVDYLYSLFQSITGIWDIDNTTSWYALVMPWDTVNATAFYSVNGWDIDNATSWYSTSGAWDVDNTSSYLATNGYITNATMNKSVNGVNIVAGLVDEAHIDADIARDSELTGGTITGSGTSGYLTRWNATAQINSSVVFEGANGNIGIGKTSGNYRLDVDGGINATTLNATNINTQGNYTIQGLAGLSYNGSHFILGS